MNLCYLLLRELNGHSLSLPTWKSQRHVFRGAALLLGSHSFLIQACSLIRSLISVCRRETEANSKLPLSLVCPLVLCTLLWFERQRKSCIYSTESNQKIPMLFHSVENKYSSPSLANSVTLKSPLILPQKKEGYKTWATVKTKKNRNYFPSFSTRHTK